VFDEQFGACADGFGRDTGGDDNPWSAVYDAAEEQRAAGHNRGGHELPGRDDGSGYSEGLSPDKASERKRQGRP